MSPIILVLGAGSNLGGSIARKFAEGGFKVATASRSIKSSSETKDFLQIKADFSNPSSVKTVFDEVSSKLGIPNVVVYNAYTMHFTAESPVELSVSDFSASLEVNIGSVYAAAQAAISGFEKLPADVKKTFIFTGNSLNAKPIPALIDLGVGKAASAHLIQALGLAYNDKGFNFYFADQRTPEGGAMGASPSGPAHAEFYFQLASQKEQLPWDGTFVEGKGYVDFGGKVAAFTGF